jgi:uncharacterized iron-regulated protein
MMKVSLLVTILLYALYFPAISYSIAQSLSEGVKALVLHITGIFHVEGRMGTPEQLEKLRPQTRAIVIAIMPASEASQLDAESLKKSGDFLIVTESAQP